MRTKPKFIEHFESPDGNFITDIWYVESTGIYSSVVTDLYLYEVKYTSLDDIRGAIYNFYIKAY